MAPPNDNPDEISLADVVMPAGRLLEIEAQEKIISNIKQIQRVNPEVEAHRKKQKEKLHNYEVEQSQINEFAKLLEAAQQLTDEKHIKLIAMKLQEISDLYQEIEKNHANVEVTKEKIAEQAEKLEFAKNMMHRFGMLAKIEKSLQEELEKPIDKKDSERIERLGILKDLVQKDQMPPTPPTLPPIPSDEQQLENEKAKALQQEYNHLANPFTALVMCGGGIKGWAEQGSLIAAQEAGLLKKIDTAVGTSVGGLNAGMFALGYDVAFTSNFLAEMTPATLQDPTKDTQYVYKDEASKRDMVRNLIGGSHSAMEGDKLFELAQGLVGDKLGNPNATFADLEEAIRQSDDPEAEARFRHLIVTATVKNDHRGGDYQIVLSAETTPHMPIAVALRMTSSFPFGFPPYSLEEADLAAYQEGATKPLVQYQRKNVKRRKGNYETYDDDIEQIRTATGPIEGQVKGGKGRLLIDDGGVPGDSANLPLYVLGDRKDQVLGLNLADDGKTVALQQLKEGYQQLLAKHPCKESKGFQKGVKKLYAQYLLSQKGSIPAKLEHWYIHSFRGANMPPGDMLVEMLDQISSPNTATIGAMDFGITLDQKEMMLNNGYNELIRLCEAQGLSIPNKHNADFKFAQLGDKDTITLSADEIAKIKEIDAFIGNDVKLFEIASEKLGLVRIHHDRFNQYMAAIINKHESGTVTDEVTEQRLKDLQIVLEAVDKKIEASRGMQINEFEELLERGGELLDSFREIQLTEGSSEVNDWKEMKELCKSSLRNHSQLARSKEVLEQIMVKEVSDLSVRLSGAGSETLVTFNPGMDKEEFMKRLKAEKVAASVVDNFRDLVAYRDALNDAIKENGKRLSKVERFLYVASRKKYLPNFKPLLKRVSPQTVEKFDKIDRIRETQKNTNLMLDYVKLTKKHKSRKKLEIRTKDNLDRINSVLTAAVVEVKRRTTKRLTEDQATSLNSTIAALETAFSKAYLTNVTEQGDYASASYNEVRIRDIYKSLVQMAEKQENYSVDDFAVYLENMKNKIKELSESILDEDWRVPLNETLTEIVEDLKQKQAAKVKEQAPETDEPEHKWVSATPRGAKPSEQSTWVSATPRGAEPSEQSTLVSGTPRSADEPPKTTNLNDRLDKQLRNPPKISNKTISNREEIKRQFKKIKSFTSFLANNIPLSPREKSEKLEGHLNNIEKHFNDGKIEIPKELQEYISQAREVIQEFKDKKDLGLKERQEELSKEYRSAEDYEALWDITHKSKGVDFGMADKLKKRLSAKDDFQQIRALEKAYKAYRDDPTMDNEENVRIEVSNIAKKWHHMESTESGQYRAPQVSEDVYNFAMEVKGKIIENEQALKPSPSSPQRSQ